MRCSVEFAAHRQPVSLPLSISLSHYLRVQIVFQCCLSLVLLLWQMPLGDRAAVFGGHLTSKEQ